MLPADIWIQMEDDVLKKLKEMEKYIPFIDYMVDLDDVKYEKLALIKKWILSRKRYPTNVLKSIEQSMITQFKNLFLERKPPRKLINVFNDIFAVKYVDLCSDDENDVAEDINKDIIEAEPCPPKFNDACQIQLNSGNIEEKDFDEDIVIVEESCPPTFNDACQIQLKSGDDEEKGFDEDIEIVEETCPPKSNDVCKNQSKSGDDKKQNIIENIDKDITIITDRCPPKANGACQNQSKASVISDVLENTNLSIQNEGKETSQRTHNVNIEEQTEVHCVRSEHKNTLKDCKNVQKCNMDNKDDTTEIKKLFKRREDFLEVNTEKNSDKEGMLKKHKIKDRVEAEKTIISNVCVEVISVDSSTDDENVENGMLSVSSSSGVYCESLKTNKKQPQQQDVVAAATLNGKPNEGNSLREGVAPVSTAPASSELRLAPDQTESSTANLPTAIETHSDTIKTGTPNENIEPSINVSNSKHYENMNIDQLCRAYEDLKEKTGIELECYLEDLIINLDKQSSELDTNDKHVSGDGRNYCSSSDFSATGNNILAQRSSCTPYIYCNNNSTLSQTHPYSGFKYPNVFYSSCNQQFPPLLKFNLNDPRIMKRLKEIVESPNHSTKVRNTAASLSCRIPSTYGEHKRQKEAQEELNRRKVEEKRLNEAEAAQKKNKSELEANELKKLNQLKQTNNIKEILLTTLQPHRDKIEDMLRKNSATKTLTAMANPGKQHPNLVHSKGNQSNDLNTTNVNQKGKSTVLIPPPRERRESICNEEHSGSAHKHNLDTANTKKIENTSTIPPSKTKKARRKSICESGAKRIVNRRKTIDGNFKIQRCESPKTSSSDTDTFDYESFKLEKLKSLAIKNSPVVLLHRLRESDMPKYQTNLQPLQSEVAKQTLEVQLVEDTSKTMSEKLKMRCEGIPILKQMPKRPNTDSKMTERNTTFCVLCKSKPANLANHYLRNHKTESYVSRLTRAQLDILKLNVPIALSFASQYKVKCYFCDADLVDSFLKLYNHYSTHTGEYAFQCSTCGLQKPFRVDIQSHQHHSKACRNTRIQNLYLYQANADVIYLHCCRICNFVQLNEANVLKHLRDHHSEQHGNPAHVQKYILAKIKNEESDGTLDGNRIGAESSFELYADDGVTVSNAAICEEEENLSGEIKPEIEKLLVTLNPGKYCGEKIMSKACEISLPTASADASAFHFDSPFSGAISSASVTNTAYSKRPIHVPMMLPPEKEDIKSEIIYLESQLRGKHEMDTDSKSTHQQKVLIRDFVPIQNYKTYPEEVSFFGLLKCMVAGCLFSSDIDDEMVQHLNSSSCSGKNGFLNCAYCQLDSFDSPDMLINHTREKHHQNRFQCSKCSYRSCMPGNVVIHGQHVHYNEEDASNFMVYECERQVATFNGQSLQRIEMLMSDNVKKLRCLHCSEGFYALKSMAEHLKRANNGAIIDVSAYNRYVCIYCSLSSKDDAYMQKHLALDHPGETPCICERVLKPNAEVDSVKNLQTTDVTFPVPPNRIVSVNDLQSRVKHPSSTNPNLESQIMVITSTTTSNCNNEAVTIETKSTDLNSDTSITESLLPDVSEVKPGLEKLIEINIDTLKPLLLKLTSNTGVPSDVLYRCPKTNCAGYFSIFEHWYRHMVARHQCIIAMCPHCVTEASDDEAELPLTDFKQHFEQHRRHLFLCFHCGETYVNEDSLRKHAAVVHNEINDLRIEEVPSSLSESYHVLIDSSLDIDRLKFLSELREIVLNRLLYLETMESQLITSQWTVPSTALWLDDFPNFCALALRVKRCISSDCSFYASNAEELFAHVRSNHKIVGHIFKCNRCAFKINSDTWDPILEHIQMHNSNIYICCVCSYYHFDRSMMSRHIKETHDSRDVPVLSLLRCDTPTKVAIAVVHSTKRCTFSTINSCFCCSASNFDPGTLGMHLKKAHKLTLRYFCEICHERLLKLQDTEEHFRSKHTLESLKIRCELASSSQLTIDTVTPLQARITSQLSTAKRPSKSVECEDNTQQPPSKILKTTSSAVIKQEQNIDDSDDCEIIDEDDVVIADKLKNCGIKQQSVVGAPAKLKCVNIENLMLTQDSYPLVTTSSPTTPTVRIVTPTKTVHCKNVRILKYHSSNSNAVSAIATRTQTPAFTRDTTNQPLKSLVQSAPPKSQQQQKSGVFSIPVLNNRRQEMQGQLPFHLNQQQQPHRQQQYQQHHVYSEELPRSMLNQSTNQTQLRLLPSNPSSFANLHQSTNVPHANNQYQHQRSINFNSDPNNSPSS